jgi:HEAT repeats
MEQRRKIDNSLTERRGILDLLESLKKEDISFAEMEDIGIKLQKSGKRAVSPLVRRLWREKSGDLISRYAYLLDYFDDETWIDQLIQITIKRQDLEDEGKEALLGILEDCGVDVSGPPFPLLQGRDGASLRATLPKLLDKGEDGLVCFVEDVLFLPPEERLVLIRELPRVNDHRIPTLLEILAGVDNREIRLEAVAALGRVKDAGAAAVLQRLLDDRDGQVRDAAARSIRRLSFLGMDTGKKLPLSFPAPFHAAYASPFDGTGGRTVWVARKAGVESLAVLCLQLHETGGLKAAWGSDGVSSDEFASYLEDTGCGAGIVEVSPDYALTLIRDALTLGDGDGLFLTAEFYVWRRRFGPGEVFPEAYSPLFAGWDLQTLGNSARLIAGSAALFDDEFFVGWGLAKGRVCDFAEEWIELEKSAEGPCPARGMEALLMRFCTELLVPELARLRRRLLLTADLMRQTGREKALVEKALAAAMSLDAPQFRHRVHPFLKRLALESMDLAREALAEGYDLRLCAGDEDDWE